MLIKQYIVNYINANGQQVNMTAIASSQDEAIALLGIDVNSVVGVLVDWQFAKKTNIAQQIQILTRISGGVNSGQAIDEYLFSIIDDFNVGRDKKTKIQLELDRGEPLSCLLKNFDIHPIVCALVENGEVSCDLKTALIKSKDFLRIEEKSNKATSGSIKSNLIMLLTALGLIFGFPIFVKSFFENIQENGLKVTANFSTDILFFLANYGIFIFIFLAIIVIAILLKKDNFLSTFGRFYPVSIFNGIITSKASILFINIYYPLFEAKMTIENIINSYQKINANNAKIIQDNILSGLSISESIQKIDFSKTFKLGFKGFSQISNKKAKLELLSDLSMGLNDDVITYSKQANQLISSLSYALIATIIVILLHGFIIPQMSLSV